MLTKKLFQNYLLVLLPSGWFARRFLSPERPLQPLPAPLWSPAEAQRSFRRVSTCLSSVPIGWEERVSPLSRQACCLRTTTLSFTPSQRKTLFQVASDMGYSVKYLPSTQFLTVAKFIQYIGPIRHSFCDLLILEEPTISLFSASLSSSCSILLALDILLGSLKNWARLLLNFMGLTFLQPVWGFLA